MDVNANEIQPIVIIISLKKSGITAFVIFVSSVFSYFVKVA